MPLIIDTINKILFITSHKCGISTISSFVLNNYTNNNYLYGYGYNKIKELGYTEYKEEYNNYYKILVLRNPYERFISSILEDTNTLYKDVSIDLTFRDFCKYLEKIYDTPHVDYIIDKNNDKIKLPFYLTNLTNSTNSIEITKNLLTHHLEGQIKQTYYDILKVGEKFDKIIMLDQLQDTLEFIKDKYKLSTNIFHVNTKCKSPDVNLDIINTNINDFKNISCFPTYDKFYNDEIKNICEKIYSDDFILLQKYGINKTLTI